MNFFYELIELAGLSQLETIDPSKALKLKLLKGLKILLQKEVCKVIGRL
jgi:hypothetical protein